MVVFILLFAVYQTDRCYGCTTYCWSFPNHLIFVYPSLTETPQRIGRLYLWMQTINPMILASKGDLNRPAKSMLFWMKIFHFTVKVTRSLKEYHALRLKSSKHWPDKFMKQDCDSRILEAWNQAGWCCLNKFQFNNCTVGESNSKLYIVK